MKDTFPNKDAAEKVVLTFDFAPELASGETLSGDPQVSVAALSGTDPVPANLLNGAAEIDGAAVLVPVKDGVRNAQYAVKVVMATSNSKKVLAITGKLYVV